MPDPSSPIPLRPAHRPRCPPGPRTARRQCRFSNGSMTLSREPGMDYRELQQRSATLATGQIADACVRLQVPVRCGPARIRAVAPGSRLAGRVAPARHLGSVDIFLEALERAAPGDVLVVDNGGRLDEACVGDLIALEAQAAGLAGIVIWGLHRDTADIQTIGLPVFSLGAIPTGPQRLDPRPPDALESAMAGDWTVSGADMVLGDDDVLTLAETIRDTERRQAERIRTGVTLRSQVHFDSYLARREQMPALTFREHLRAIGGAVEE